MRKIPGLVAAIGAIAFLAARTEAAVTVSKVDYNGWQGAYKMTNGTVELVFVPQIGRVMRYGYVGGANVLWNNTELSGKTTDLKSNPKDWLNYGGDKLWVSPQSVWGWPPDPALDSGVQRVRISPDNHLLTTGMQSKVYGVQYQREIILAESGTGVTFKNTLTNSSTAPVEWGIWEVTQVNDPKELNLPLYKGGKFPMGYYNFKDADPAPGYMKLGNYFATVTRSATKSSKIGSDSPLGFILADVQGVNFRVRAKRIASTTYPDEGCSLELYTNPDPLKYAELELMAPVEKIAPGKQTHFETKWSLEK